MSLDQYAGAAISLFNNIRTLKPEQGTSTSAHVEQNLFGLTAALSAANQSSLPAGGGTPVDLGDASIGSHERLARTASTLFS